MEYSKRVVLFSLLASIILVSGCISKDVGDLMCKEIVEKTNATRGSFQTFSQECYVYFCEDIDGSEFCRKETYVLQ